MVCVLFHPRKIFLSNQDEFLRWNSSLQDISIKSGCISPLEFIPAKHFHQIRMHFPAGIHPSKTFPSNQDAFLRWNSSLQDISIKSGCIPPLEFIPSRHFHQIRMNSSAGIHPSKTFLSNQDAFLRRNSSPQDISIKSGCISPPEFIPPRHFHQIRMHSSAGNHPSKTFPSNQDAFLRRNSSLPGISIKSG